MLKWPKTRFCKIPPSTFVLKPPFSSLGQIETESNCIVSSMRRISNPEVYNSINRKTTPQHNSLFLNIVQCSNIVTPVSLLSIIIENLHKKNIQFQRTHSSSIPSMNVQYTFLKCASVLRNLTKKLPSNFKRHFF